MEDGELPDAGGSGSSGSSRNQPPALGFRPISSGSGLRDPPPHLPRRPQSPRATGSGSHLPSHGPSRRFSREYPPRVGELPPRVGTLPVPPKGPPSAHGKGPAQGRWGPKDTWIAPVDDRDDRDDRDRGRERGRKRSRSWSSDLSRSRSPPPRRRSLSPKRDRSRSRERSPGERSRSRGRSRSRDRSLSPRPIPEGVLGSLSTFTNSLQNVMLKTSKRELASRALDRLAGFTDDQATLASAGRELAAADRALRNDTDALQDAFIDLLRRALAAPGVAKGDVGALQIEKLIDRIASIEKGVPLAIPPPPPPGERPDSPHTAPPSQPPPKIPPPPSPPSDDETEDMELDPTPAPPTPVPAPGPSAGPSGPSTDAPKDNSLAAKRQRVRELLHSLISRVEEGETKMEAAVDRVDDFEEALAERDYEIEEFRQDLNRLKEFQADIEDRRQRARDRRTATAAPTATGSAATSRVGTPAVATAVADTPVAQADSAPPASELVPATPDPAPPPPTSDSTTVPSAELAEMRTMMAQMRAEITALKSSQAEQTAKVPATPDDISTLRAEVEKVRHLVTDGHLRPIIARLLQESLPPVITNIFERSREAMSKKIMRDLLAIARQDGGGSGGAAGPSTNAGGDAGTSGAANGSEARNAINVDTALPSAAKGPISSSDNPIVIEDSPPTENAKLPIVGATGATIPNVSPEQWQQFIARAVRETQAASTSSVQSPQAAMSPQPTHFSPQPAPMHISPQMSSAHISPQPAALHVQPQPVNNGAYQPLPHHQLLRRQSQQAQAAQQWQQHHQQQTHFQPQAQQPLYTQAPLASPLSPSAVPAYGVVSPPLAHMPTMQAEAEIPPQDQPIYDEARRIRAELNAQYPTASNEELTNLTRRKLREWVSARAQVQNNVQTIHDMQAYAQISNNMGRHQ